MTEFFDDTDRAAWRRAAFLDERLAPTGAPDDAGRERCERWREDMFVGRQLFRTRLAVAGLDEDGLRRIATATDHDVRPGATGWTRTLAGCWAAPGELPELALPQPLFFAEFHAPFLRYAHSELRAGTERLDLGDMLTRRARTA